MHLLSHPPLRSHLVKILSKSMLKCPMTQKMIPPSLLPSPPYLNPTILPTPSQDPFPSTHPYQDPILPSPLLHDHTCSIIHDDRSIEEYLTTISKASYPLASNGLTSCVPINEHHIEERNNSISLDVGIPPPLHGPKSSHFHPKFPIHLVVHLFWALILLLLSNPPFWVHVSLI